MSVNRVNPIQFELPDIEHQTKINQTISKDSLSENIQTNGNFKLSELNYFSSQRRNVLEQQWQTASSRNALNAPPTPTPAPIEEIERGRPVKTQINSVSELIDYVKQGGLLSNVEINCDLDATKNPELQKLFAGRDLTGTVFNGRITATNLNSSGSNALDFTGAKLNGAVFTEPIVGPNLNAKGTPSGIIFAGTDLTKTQFMGSVYGVDFQGASAVGAIFKHGAANNNFSGANLEKAEFYGNITHNYFKSVTPNGLGVTNLQHTKFIGNVYDKNNFDDADLSSALFRGRVENNSFRGADLTDVTFWLFPFAGQAVFQGSNDLTGAIMNSTTISVSPDKLR